MALGYASVRREPGAARTELSFLAWSRAMPQNDRDLGSALARWSCCRLRSSRGVAVLQELANQIFSAKVFANQNRGARQTFSATMTAQLPVRLCLSDTSVPISKFVSTCDLLVRTSESIRTLAKLFLLAPLLNQKFASVNSGILCGVQVRGTRQPVDKYDAPPNAMWRRCAWRSR